MDANVDIKVKGLQQPMTEISDILHDGSMFGAKLDKQGRITVPEDVRIKQRADEGDWMIFVCKKMR